MRIVLLGAPGSGKGTQTRRLARLYGIPQFATGDLLRDAIASGSKLGKEAKAAMDSGDLVADELVLELLEERLRQSDARQGFLLDGFPRNIPQAQALDNRLGWIGRPVQIALYLQIDKEILVERITGRTTCSNCGAIYNDATNPPKKLGVCDFCGGTQFNRRSDDNLETVRQRMETYERETEPLVVYYRAQQKVRTVNADAAADEITARLCRIIDAELRPLGTPITEANIIALADPEALSPLVAEAKKKASAKGKRRAAKKKTADKAKDEKPAVETPAPAAAPAPAKAETAAGKTATTAKKKAPATASAKKKPALKKAAKKKPAAKKTTKKKTAAKKKPVVKKAVKKKPAAKKVAKKPAKKAAKKAVAKAGKKATKKAAKAPAKKKAAAKKTSKKKTTKKKTTRKKR